MKMSRWTHGPREALNYNDWTVNILLRNSSQTDRRHRGWRSLTSRRLLGCYRWLGRGQSSWPPCPASPRPPPPRDWTCPSWRSPASSSPSTCQHTASHLNVGVTSSLTSLTNVSCGAPDQTLARHAVWGAPRSGRVKEMGWPGPRH